MGTKCTVLISDLHLGDTRWTEQRYRLFNSFLNEFVLVNAERLIIAGDLLEWLQYDVETLGRAKDAVLLLQALPLRGVEVIYVVGNHDIDLCRLAEKEMPAPVIYPRLHLQLYGASVHVEHGHFYDITITKFPQAANFLTRWGGRLLDALGPGLEDALGEFKRILLDQINHTTGQGGKAGEQQDTYVQAASQLALEGNHDVVVFGHTHKALIRPLHCRAGKNTQYVNSGDWQVHSDFVVFTPNGKVRLHSWERIASPRHG